MRKFEEIVALLRSETSLPPHLHDHLLSGSYIGHRELHIEADWLLVYQVLDDCLHLVRIGTHSDLFD